MSGRNGTGEFAGGICLVGRGRVAASLAAALEERGLRWWVVRGRSQGPAAETALREAQVYWLCVPDGAIAATAVRVVRELQGAGMEVRGRVTLHASGVHDVSVLQAAAEAGMQVGSVHPLMSFPTRKVVSLRGVPMAVEARGRLRKRLMELVRRLGGRPFAVPSDKKALYHAAATMASPLLVSLVSAIEETARLAGLSARESKAVLRPMMERTLENAQERGGERSFSGPLARGDAATVSLHLRALRAHPHLRQVYRSLALYALEALPVQNKLELRKTLRSQGPCEDSKAEQQGTKGLT